MSVRDELKQMSNGFRWGRRPLVPRSAEPYAPEKRDDGFPTDWARTDAGVAVRQVLLKGVMKPILWNELSMRVYGLENLEGVEGPLVFYSNHTSHLDATIIMTTLPNEWQSTTAVGAAKDYFFDVWWRQAFTAIVYGAFPIERGGGGAKATNKARELLDDGWSLVVFPEGARSPDGHVQRFRHGTARLCLEAGVAALPIGIRGAYQAMPKGRNWPIKGRRPVSVRYGRPIEPVEGETHQEFSRRMTLAIAQLHDEDRSTWWEALKRAEAGATPSLSGPAGPGWLRKWEGSRPVPRRGPERTWE
ncbi:MAG TPA: lysophospholipid acyltransferase family protein [Actinomycetota bacterium]|jgi:1-acyl-sn-glycerol-3-phosphate acyltransferase|nr:lysophospholipid acyltransferase family protein [Actinomycetota bacterium]